MSLLSAAELVVLAALSWPWTRLLVDPRRRLARTAPRYWAVLAALLGGATAAAVLSAFFAPFLLHVATAFAIVVAAVAGWRSRPGYGRSRRLPPGSLALSRSIEAVVDRGFYAREWRRHGPIFKMAQWNRPVVCVVGLELGHDLIRRHHDRLGPSALPWNDELRGGFLRYMDDSTHEVYGALFRIALAGPIVATAEPATRRAARRELGRLAHGAADNGGRSNVASAVAPGGALDRIVLSAFARVLFGIDDESPLMGELERDYAVLRAQPLSTPLEERPRAAIERLRVLLEHRTAELRRRREAGEPRTACALDELEHAAPGMPDGVCVDNLLFILRLGTDNTGALLRWLVKTLGENPRWSDRLRDEVAASGETGARGLADRIVMETLRLAQSDYLYRVVREPFEHGGYTFPAGWQIRVCVHESHRDETIWPDAAKFDPDRFLARGVPGSHYSPFGFHRHACNGVDLNNMICRATLEELASGFDWSIARDGELERDFRHWSHWRPSRDFAIAIRDRRGPAPR